jgi:hypothetical protein
MCHNNTTAPCAAPTNPYPITSYKMPYDSGIITATSNDQTLQFYGDINQDGFINYVVYSIFPSVLATTVCIPAVAPGTACAAANTYTLYDLYRSITPVAFPSLPPGAFAASCPGPSCNNPASPMVEKVLYNAANKVGPTGLPIFAYPNPIVIGVVPNTTTVTGTIVITLCIAVNPKSLESSQVTFFTMATQIRPLNLYNAVNVNNTGGGVYLPPQPLSLPMAIPTGYYP